MRIVVVASTGGSVINELLKNPFFKSHIYSVISDRECPAIEKARLHEVRTDVIPEKNKERISELILEYLREHRADYVIAFFTKLFVGDLVTDYGDRIVNLHPSLLPSFKGMHGFDDAVRYGTRYVGSTIHFIDENMDEGRIILQTVLPVDTNVPISVIRHRVFEQQCRSLLQVVKWLEDGRIEVQGRQVMVKGARFEDTEFAPNLDFDQAVDLRIPLPADFTFTVG
jgi:phosphoribosylglycinamide formyltransferase-1